MTVTPPPLPANRRSGVDLARGLAVIAMVAYHCTWDLGFFNLVEGFPATTPLGRLAAHTIAMSFLALCGISLVLASQKLNFQSKFWRRQFVLGLCAGAVSLGTYVYMPESWIFFGILHCIFVASLIGYALINASTVWLIALSLISLRLPELVNSPLFDQPTLIWLGLGHLQPYTNDFAPLFPSVSAVFAGMIFARFKFPHLPFANDNVPAQHPHAFRRLIQFCGRHSLSIYLIHQPLMFGIFFAFTSLTNTAEARFEKDCQIQCASSGGLEKVCASACSCVTDELKSHNLWTPLLEGKLDADGQSLMSDFALVCGKKAKAAK